MAVYMTITGTQAEQKRQPLVQILIGLQLSLLLAAVDQTVVTTAIPGIVARLNGFERYSWVTSIYLLMSTAAIPIFGRLSDYYGRKPLMLMGLGLFAVSSFMCASAGQWALPLDAMSQLIAARALQGLAAGVVMTLTFTLVADLFSAAERGKYQGVFAAVFALAAIAGPALGGYLTEHFSWRLVFYINLPVAVLAIAILSCYLPSTAKSERQTSIDYAGVLALLGFLLPFMLAVDAFNQGGNKTSSGYLLLVAAISLLLLVLIESKAATPVLPLALFRLKAVAISLVSVFVSGIGMFGSLLLIPLFMQNVSGMSATSSGVFLTPLMVVVAAFSVISGQLVARYGRYKALILSGWVFMALGCGVLSGMSRQTELSLILAAMLVTGAGLGILLPLYTIVIQAVSPESMLGIATALSQFFRTSGGAVGTAVFGSMMIGCYQLHLQQHLSPALWFKHAALLGNPLNALPVVLMDVLGSEPGGKQLAETIFQQSRDSLVYAIDKVFLVYALVLVVTILLNFWLPVIPLRGKSSVNP
jgi:EmrB/QacA subfamily drug resistance transporter